MRKLSKILKNIVISFTIVSFVLAPFLSSYNYAEAQLTTSSTTSGYSTTGSAYSGNGIQGYISGLSPLLSQLPLCKNEIKTAGIKGLFRSNEKLLQESQNAQMKASLNKMIDDEVYGEGAIKTIDQLARDQNQEILDKQVEISKNIAALAENDRCLQSIGKVVIKILLQKITLSTVEWIQGGFEGGPAFVQDADSFFTDIAKDEILGFALEINDPDLYPYGSDFLRYQAEAFNNKFQDNARYSLNELIQTTTPEYSDVAFKADFSSGGWDAWTFMTQVPANNPLGFQIIASEELSKRLEGTEQSFATQLREDIKQASGYLGDYRCADPLGITKAEHQEYLSSQGDSGTYCKKWEYVTPGTMVAEAATKIVNYPDNNLLAADDLNDAVAAILDALLARFSADLMEQGFADFSTQGSDGAFVLNYDELTSGGYNQAELDIPDYLINSSNWLNENRDFNIRTDVTQSLIDEQRIYIEKLEEQNELIQTIIKTIRQLDYCIPGPNPLWEQESSVDEFYSTVKTKPMEEMPFAASLALSFDPTGIVSGIANAIFNNNQENLVKSSIARQLANIFDVWIDGADGQSPIQDQVIDAGGMKNLISNSFESYRSIISKVYFAGDDSLAPMPQVTKDARKYYYQIDGYENITQENLSTISTMRSVVSRLAQIKEGIDAMGLEADSPMTNELQEWAHYFARLTRDMVTGNDIAALDNINKEISETERYIWNNLIKGPGGCEAEIASLDDFTKSKYVRRQPYPYPIYYLYEPIEGENNNNIQQSYERFFGNHPAFSSGGGYWSGNANGGVWSSITSIDSQYNGTSGTWADAQGSSGTWTINPQESLLLAGYQVQGTWAWTVNNNPNSTTTAADVNSWTPQEYQNPTTGVTAEGTIPWSENLPPIWDKNQGFLYGALYYNQWTGPQVVGTPNIHSYRDGGNPYYELNSSQVCEEYMFEFNGVELSLPGGVDDGGYQEAVDNGGLPDIGGLGPNEIGFENNCGVITRQFEKIFNIY